MIDESLYHQIVASIPICYVNTVIIHEGKALLVLRSNEPAKGQWWLPGGRVVKGEKLCSTAWRKAREIGLDCVVGPVIHQDELYFGDIHMITFCFLLFPKNDSVVLDGKHRDYAWVQDPGQFYVMGEDVERVRLHTYVLACLKKAGL